MGNSRVATFCSILGLIIMMGMASNDAFAQLEEPEVQGKPEPITPLSEGYHNTIGFDVMLNNFGFGIGGTYSRVLGHYTELTFRTGISGLRDVSEQNFQNFLTGRQIVPNKYKRALAFPFLLGVRQRLFASHIDDSFRLFVSGSAGPAAAFVYPYIQDANDNGFRDYRLTQNGIPLPTEPVNDFFSGWSDGEFEWGFNGELTIGADIGRSFGTRTTVEFGYFFYYFEQGLQMMEQYQPFGYDDQGLPIEINENGNRNPFFDDQEYFGTPIIRFTFGGMW